MHALHYHSLYYNYAAEAVKIILYNLPDYEEKTELERLRNIYSERFEAMQIKMKFDAVKRKSEWRNQALVFTNALAFDFLDNNNFIKWLEKNQGKKVVILKCQDTAGQILIKGLKKYRFDIIFSSTSSNFDKMTEDQMSLCREADMVITANIHSTITPQRDGIKAICISDLLKITHVNS